jgi:hypothetical protein
VPVHIGFFIKQQPDMAIFFGQGSSKGNWVVMVLCAFMPLVLEYESAFLLQK